MADSTVGDISKMKVVELRKELKTRGLAHTGDKSELVARLQAAMAQDEEHGDINLSDEIDSDGVLEDDDDKDAEKDIVLDESAVELALADHPPAEEPEAKPKKPVLKRKISAPKEDAKNGENKETGHKKIVLNRATSLTAVTAEKKTETTDEKPSEEKPTESSDKIKITADIDAKTRLELRAKRFGLPVKAAEADRIEARKKRFNQESSTTTTASTATTKTAVTAPDATPASLSENLDKLKKRAERFGESVSKIMSDIENKERLEKRKAKFGTAK